MARCVRWTRTPGMVDRSVAFVMPPGSETGIVARYSKVSNRPPTALTMRVTSATGAWPCFTTVRTSGRSLAHSAVSIPARSG